MNLFESIRDNHDDAQVVNVDEIINWLDCSYRERNPYIGSEGLRINSSQTAIVLIYAGVYCDCLSETEYMQFKELVAKARRSLTATSVPTPMTTQFANCAINNHAINNQSPF